MTPTAVDVAKWMMTELQRRRELYQDDVVHRIERRFGKTFIHYNEFGNAAIGQNVLAAFRKVSGDDVVWSRTERYWRFRQRGDASGRQQD